ncbi:MAG TPA: response regulator, partial [Fibrobacteria bacterium]|nr:response regulator [Fibrobacteria bacterium]
GTGLGLSISKSLVEMMGGAIGYRDGRCRGSEFWFTLPVSSGEGRGALPAAAARVEEAELPPPAVPRAAGLRVLVVDDNAVNRKVAEGMLVAMDCEIESAGGGAEALERLAAGSYDLILMDCEMPGMNGFETTLEIRRGEEEGCLPRTPVYALTANVLAGSRERCEAAGMDGYLAKPFQMEELRRIVRHILTLSRSGPSVASGSEA